MIAIYKITNPKGRVYIGKTTNWKKRLQNYKNLQCKDQPQIYRSLKKYGFDKHIFEILAECLVEDLSERERYYQDLYEVIGKSGMNCRLEPTDSRSGSLSEDTKKKMSICKKGHIVSKETRELISKKLTGQVLSIETRKKISDAGIGRVVSPEARRKSSETQKGRVLSDERKKQISKIQTGKITPPEVRDKISLSAYRSKKVININTKTIYLSVKRAAILIGFKYWDLKDMLNGKKKNTSKLIYL